MEKDSVSNKKVMRKLFLLFAAFETFIIFSSLIEKSISDNTKKEGSQKRITSKEELTVDNYRRPYNPDETFRYITDKGHVKKLVK